MKILYVVPEGMDLGGIITSSENLMAGFREAGHQATFAFLKHNDARYGEPRGAQADQFVWSPHTEMFVHPVSGWRGNYFSTARPEEFIGAANNHDIVVWGALYGLLNDATKGRTAWARCITGHKRPQVFMVRDDHLEGRVPWAMAFAPYAAGWVGVQQCSFDSCAGLIAPRALVSSGHPPPHPKAFGDHKRHNRSLAVATWKPWKQGRTLLQAVPHLKHPLIVAGDGIEFRYMRSPEKARDRDFYPDGRRIWDVAFNDSKATYVGPITEEARDVLMLNSKLVVDTSYRQNSGQINRVVVEAMRHGCVPLAHPDFVDPMLEPGKHYVPIDLSSPETLASIVNNAMRGPLDEYRANGLALVSKFSRAEAAKAIVALAMHKTRGVGLKYARGKPDPDKLERGRAAFRAEFGGNLDD